jgi:FkbM family methyltransferase
VLRYIKPLVESATGCRIYRHGLPHGTDLYVDIDRCFGIDLVRTVFDVGANVGQSALAYSRCFPRADIYAFEPVASTYRDLERMTKHCPRIRLFNRGMGAARCTMRINVNPLSLKSSIVHSRAEDHAEMAQIDSICEFAAEHDIDRIDFLKIDTEGYELEVLRGAAAKLESQHVRLVQAECEPIANSGYFVSLPALGEFLLPFGYELFGIYEQQLNWNGNRSVQYFNAVFACPDLITGFNQ